MKHDTQDLKRKHKTNGNVRLATNFHKKAGQ